MVLSLQLLSHSSTFLQYLFWVGFPVLFVLFSVAFVHIVSIHAIGVSWLPWLYLPLSLLL